MSNLRQCNKCNTGYLAEYGHACPMEPVLALRQCNAGAFIVGLTQLNDLIKIALELGEGITDVSQNLLLEVNEHLAYLTPAAYTEFVQCRCVLEVYSGVIKLRDATEAEQAIMLALLTGRVAA